MRTQSKYRLLVVRVGAMGDILHALPAVTALRAAHPGWAIDWVVEPVWAPLLSADPSAGLGPSQPVVDRLHFAATRRWRKAPFSAETRIEISKLRRDLRSAKYDAVLDLQGSIRSAVLGRLSGCRRRIGEADPRERPARWLFTEHIAPRAVHVIGKGIELANAVAGDDLSYLPAALPVDAAAEDWCASLGLPAQPLALLHPGAGWGAKRWPAERYGEVAAALAMRGFVPLVNSAPGEEQLAEDVRQASGGAARPVSSTIAQLIALTRRAGLVVGGDTGPLHLACALERPVVGVFGPTDPARNGPYGTRFRVLRSPQSRRDHTRREETEAGLLTIPPSAALAAIDEIFASETAQ